jgi:hypothetical protein
MPVTFQPDTERLHNHLNMDYKQITERKQIRTAFNTLRRALRSGSRSYPRTLGHQGESWSGTVHWHTKSGFRTIVDSNIAEKRFWISFGTQDPAQNTSLSITCQSNVPKVGIDHRRGGELYQAGPHTYLCGNGRVGGGGKGIGKTAFLAWYADRFGITWPPGIIVGDLSGSNSTFLASTAKFVRAVEQFKVEVKTEGGIDQELDRDADSAQSEGEFAPRGIQGDRERALRSINIRRGQPEFRKTLLKAYSGKCAMSGYDCVDSLEAAHIGGYWNEDSNHVQNGLLLRGDLHTLFDLGKIGVDPNTFRIIVSEQLMPTLYGKLSGKKVCLPARQAQWPNPEVLRDHVKRWKLQWATVSVIVGDALILRATSPEHFAGKQAHKRIVA